MVDKVLFSSKRTDWETPPEIFNPLNKEFGFILDVCADEKNSKCLLYYNEEKNGLIQPWKGACWMNPPYGINIGKWIKKASEESINGATIVCLLPARTDTKWFHDYIYGKAEIRFIKGRIRFVGSKYPAPFPSMIAIYRGAGK